jgi:predicted nucleotidyltransferase component of viral defense system
MLLERVALWVQETSGIRMGAKAPHAIPGDFQVEIPVEYGRGRARTRGLPAVKIHVTFDEPILTEVVACSIRPRYSDLSEFQTAAYSKVEITAEKMRALLQQQKKWPRPRDLYDLWFILCRLKERFDAHQLRGLFVEKCVARHIQPNMEGLISEHLREWNKDAWVNLLKPMMKIVPDFDTVWQEWVTVFHKMFA